VADTGWIVGKEVAWSSQRVVRVRVRPDGWTRWPHLWRVVSPALGFVNGVSRIAADRVAADHVAADRVAHQSATMTRATRMRGAGVMAEAADLNGQQDRQNGHQE